MKMKASILLGVLPLVFFAVAGCSKQADPDKPIDQIRAEAKNMSVGDLESRARAYASEIQKRTGDMQQVQEKLQGLSPKDLLGDKARQIKDQVSRLGSEIKALSERYDVYAGQFQKLGGDLAKVQVG